MREILIKINVKGQVFIENSINFEGEHNATKLKFEISADWRDKILYLDAIYTNNSGQQKIQFPPLLEVDGEIAFFIPQILTFSQKVNFQLIAKSADGSIILASDIFSLFFKKSINATPSNIPAVQDVIGILFEQISNVDIKIENTIDWIFEQDEFIKSDYLQKFNELSEALDFNISELSTYVENLESSLTLLINDVKDSIINGAPGVLDTLLEISNALQGNPNVINELITSIAGKVDKITGKGLSTNDLTVNLVNAISANTEARHSHSNKSVLDLITSQDKQNYDLAATQSHTHIDLAILNSIDNIWKIAVDNAVARLAAKLNGIDINLNQIGLTHLTTALQQLIGSNNNITNYADDNSLISYVENSVNKMKFAGNWGEDKKGYQLDGGTSFITSTFTGIVNSFAFWIFPTANNRGILNFGTNLTVSINAANLITLGNGVTNSIIYVNTFLTNTITLNTWNFVMISCDAFTATTFEYGRVGSSYFMGKISSLYLFNRAFVAADYYNFFNNGKADFVIPHSAKSASNFERVKNGGFDTSANWGLTPTFSISNGKLNCISDGTYQSAYQLNAAIPGKLYKITLTVSDYVSGAIRVGNSGTIGNFFVLSSNGTHSAAIIMNSHVFYIEGHPACNMKVDNVSIIQLGCIMELRGESAGNTTILDSSGNGFHGTVSGNLYLIELQNIQKIWTGNFTTNIAVGVANRDLAIPAGYMIETITLRNNTAGSITNFQAILNPASWNQTLISGKTIATGLTVEYSTLADRNVDNVNNMILRFYCSGNGAGGIDIMVLLRRKD